MEGRIRFCSQGQNPAARGRCRNRTGQSQLIARSGGGKLKRPCGQDPLQAPIDQPDAVGAIHGLAYAGAVAVGEFQPLEPDVAARSLGFHFAGDIRRLGENCLRSRRHIGLDRFRLHAIGEHP